MTPPDGAFIQYQPFFEPLTATNPPGLEGWMPMYPNVIILQDVMTPSDALPSIEET